MTRRPAARRRGGGARTGGRSPARRRYPVRRRSRRRGGRDGEILAVCVAGAVAVGLAVAAVNWLLAHWWLLLVAGAAAAAAGGAWLHRRSEDARWERARAQGLRFAIGQLDALHHREFEYAVRDLMRRDGCQDAVQVGGANDNGADVKATDPAGRHWVIQCKHRRHGDQGSPVGTPDLHVLNGTARQLHGADVVVLVTNGRFSARCAPLARSQQLHLVDRRTLTAWASGSRPLWELLPRIPPPRRPDAVP
ncbi:restriction endonuclease [Streptomyces sp. NPDC059002]|uniref:restriction endonuclease n=1 Tax=Streptomyces sp. NPDC059002 TaxID=3346690 RepID=UPI0036D18548